MSTLCRRTSNASRNPTSLTTFISICSALIHSQFQSTEIPRARLTHDLSSPTSVSRQRRPCPHSQQSPAAQTLGNPRQSPGNRGYYGARNLTVVFSAGTVGGTCGGAEPPPAALTAAMMAERASAMFSLDATGPAASGMPKVAEKATMELVSLAFGAVGKLCDQHAASILAMYCSTSRSLSSIHASLSSN